MNATPETPPAGANDNPRILRWTAGTAAGAVAGAIACQLLLGSAPTGPAFVILLPLLMGAAVGAGQWLAHRDHAALPLAWIAASAVGWLPAPLFYVQRQAPAYEGWSAPYHDGYAPEPWGRERWLPALRYPEIAAPSVAAFAGIGAGIGQVLAWRGRQRRRAAWIAASTVGHFAGGVTALLLGPWILRGFVDMGMSLSESPVRDVLAAALHLASPLWYGGVMGAIAGLALAAVQAPSGEVPAAPVVGAAPATGPATPPGGPPPTPADATIIAPADGAPAVAP